MKKFKINLHKIHTKARPRFSRNGHAYHDSSYTEFLELLEIVFKSISSKCRVYTKSLYLLELNFHVRQSRKTDLDNLQGSVLDGMVRSTLLEDDSIKFLPRIKSEGILIPSKSKETLEIIFYRDFHDYYKHLTKRYLEFLNHPDQSGKIENNIVSFPGSDMKIEISLSDLKTVLELLEGSENQRLYNELKSQMIQNASLSLPKRSATINGVTIE